MADEPDNQNCEPGLGVPILAAPGDLTVPKEHMANLAEKLGAIMVPENVLGAMSEMGAEIEQRGVVRLANAYCVLTATTLLNVLSKMAVEVKDAKSAMKYSRAIASLAAKVHPFQRDLRGMEATRPRRGENAPLAQLGEFTGGQIVEQTVIVNTGQPVAGQVGKVINLNPPAT